MLLKGKHTGQFHPCENHLPTTESLLHMKVYTLQGADFHKLTNTILLKMQSQFSRLNHRISQAGSILHSETNFRNGADFLYRLDEADLYFSTHTSTHESKFLWVSLTKKILFTKITLHFVQNRSGFTQKN